MVQINVSQLLKSPLGTTRKYQIAEKVNIGEETPHVQGEVTLLRTNRGILVTGKLETDVLVTCSRCLSEYRQSVVLEIEEEFFPTTDILTGKTISVPEDEPDGFVIDQNNILDLNEAIRQYALIVIPMKPLCRENCAGLCAACGMNLNVNKCNCPPVIDPQLEKIRSINIYQ